MLARLRAKSTFPNLRLVRAPMQAFDLADERFGLIFSAFRAFQHLYTVEDQLACLACVRKHLAPGGRLRVRRVRAAHRAHGAASRSPKPSTCASSSTARQVVRYATVSRDLAAQILHVRFRYERSRGGSVVGNEHASFRMRWFWRYELEHLLARAGFTEVEIYGDFDRRPVSARTPRVRGGGALARRARRCCRRSRDR